MNQVINQVISDDHHLNISLKEYLYRDWWLRTVVQRGALGVETTAGVG